MLLQLPPELQCMIASQLATPDLVAARLTCTMLARSGYTELQKRIPNTIAADAFRSCKSTSINSAKPHPSPDQDEQTPAGVEFLSNMVIDIQIGMPYAAAKVTSLELDYSHVHDDRMHLNDALSAVRLPNLSRLVLRKVNFTRRSLETVLVNHKATLRSLEMTSVGIEASLADDKGQRSSLIGGWEKTLEKIRRALALDDLVINLLSRYCRCCHYPEELLLNLHPCLSLRGVKWHKRSLGLDQTQWFHPFAYGLVAKGCEGVREGLGEFIRKANELL